MSPVATSPKESYEFPTSNGKFHVAKKSGNANSVSPAQAHLSSYEVISLEHKHSAHK